MQFEAAPVKLHLDSNLLHYRSTVFMFHEALTNYSSAHPPLVGTEQKPEDLQHHMCTRTLTLIMSASGWCVRGEGGV